ncbi:MAG: helix-turn-helix transcriptional regulator [Oscillospiraceae bacterium]|nr:helix-turn-helix transcriptional regulator [Oscillospiraceae bacterium]
MISYEPFYRTLKEKNLSTYKLITQYGISRSLIDRLKHNKPITTVTINDLCRILQCRIEDIAIYIEE